MSTISCFAALKREMDTHAEIVLLHADAALQAGGR